MEENPSHSHQPSQVGLNNKDISDADHDLSCPNVQLIIKHLTYTFFPTTRNLQFNISDILVTNNIKISKEYDCQGGRELVNLIWDLYQVLVTVDHTASKTPNKNLTNNSIKKNFPKSSLTLLVKSIPTLEQLLH
jgi:hypothetical protein